MSGSKRGVAIGDRSDMISKPLIVMGSPDVPNKTVKAQPTATRLMAAVHIIASVAASNARHASCFSNRRRN
jgi:hypothetical protein